MKKVKKIFKFLDYPHKSEITGVNYENTNDFLYIPEIFSAKKHLFFETISLFVFIGVLSLSHLAV